MYKETLMIIMIIIIITTVDITLQSYTRNSTTSIINELKDLKEKIKEDNGEKVKEKIGTIKNDWQKKSSILAIYIEHNELEKVDTELSALEGEIETEDYKTGISDLNKCMFILDHIATKYEFSIVTVF